MALVLGKLPSRGLYFCDTLRRAPHGTRASCVLLLFLFFFSEKIRLDSLCELSTGQTVHIKNIMPYFLKKKNKKNIISSAIVTNAYTLLRYCVCTD